VCSSDLEQMIYSCAFFEDDAQSLRSAQENKLDVTLSRLEIPKKKNLSVLDIGSGWGGFAFHAAAKNGATYDGISIAQSQIDFAEARRQKLKKSVANRINFHCEDFIKFRAGESDLYDRVVSIGMLEHVGKTQYRSYFDEVYRFLKPGGIAVIHSIVRRNQGISNSWIDAYIFPGGYIPQTSEVVAGIEPTGLRIEKMHIHWGQNYRRTIQHWTENFLDNYDACYELIVEHYTEIAADDLAEDRTRWVNHNARIAMKIWYFYLHAIQSIFDERWNCYDVCQFVVRKPPLD